VLFGEKSSLEEALGPISDTYKADVYLPTGEISDTLLHQMASVGNEDGRKMVVFCISDCDPRGLADAYFDCSQAPGVPGA
jgi:hypothetical protein